MSDYISRQELMQSLGITNVDCDKCAWYDEEWSRCKRGGDFEDACYAIESAPTVDAVGVVRCKDCRWGREARGNIECFADINEPPEYHGYEWFCPNGERKEE